MIILLSVLLAISVVTNIYLLVIYKKGFSQAFNKGQIVGYEDVLKTISDIQKGP
jgi:hypothetical protein